MPARDYQQRAFEKTVAHLRNSTICTQPAFVNASVGTGKSYMIAMQAKNTADKGGKVLVLTRQGELCEQNSAEAWGMGLQNSVYSASLGRKQMVYPVIYGTEGTVARALNTDFANWRADLILIDECHMVNYDDDDTQFMQILIHFRLLNPKVRIVGYTGSPYRGTESIIGDLWKHQLEDISTDWAVANSWLVPPHFGWPDGDGFDFSGIEPSSATGDYTEAQLEEIVSGNPTLTQKIVAEVVLRTQDRNGVLIFASTKRHTEEIAAALPNGTYGVITDDTPSSERARILSAAKSGEVKYTVNVGVLTTGVNVPRWDVVVFLRPIGSLVLLTQAIGRGLRPYLSPDQAGLFNAEDSTPSLRAELIAASEKQDCLVLDFAGVMDRLGHLFDSPILDEAKLEKSQREGTVISCPRCGEMNGDTARRCKAPDPQEPDGRCGHFWVFQGCVKCGTHNDISAVSCRNPACGFQLRDPNKALLNKAYSDDEMVRVKRMDIQPTKNGGVLIRYTLEQEPDHHGHPVEFFMPSGNQNAKRAWYNNFIKKHVKDPAWRKRAAGVKSAEGIMKWKAVFDVPSHIAYRINDKGKFVIGRKRFLSGLEL